VNNQGELRTRVFRKSAAEPYVVPFLSDHPRYVHRNIIQGALYRAVRVCSNINDFNRERLTIELTLLLNGYPPRFITHNFKRFFVEHNAISLIKASNNDLYTNVHLELIHQLTGSEKRQQQLLLNKHEIRIPFTFETGPLLHIRRELHQLWKKSYENQGSSKNDILLKLQTKTNKSLSQIDRAKSIKIIIKITFFSYFFIVS